MDKSYKPKKFTATIEISDVVMTVTPLEKGNWSIEIVDMYDGRTETQLYETEREVCEIVRDFVNPSEPGPMFRKAFPFWC